MTNEGHRGYVRRRRSRKSCGQGNDEAFGSLIASGGPRENDGFVNANQDDPYPEVQAILRHLTRRASPSTDVDGGGQGGEAGRFMYNRDASTAFISVICFHETLVLRGAPRPSAVE